MPRCINDRLCAVTPFGRFAPPTETGHADETDIGIARTGPCGLLDPAAAKCSGGTECSGGTGRAGATAAGGVCTHRAGDQRPARRRRARHGDGIAREPAR
ncbi:hypothetical protein NS44R_14940 [Mammaliicoccus sciuri]|nr:hypothetical protein NS44R_14940 [Mammaliicoccus sciuri]